MLQGNHTECCFQNEELIVKKCKSDQQSIQVQTRGSNDQLVLEKTSFNL
jgi:hypothetical protein